ncbi:PRP38 pre-mRNA processing factor 38 domain-containing protein B [Balamuthia mandrillaris]
MQYPPPASGYPPPPGAPMPMPGGYYVPPQQPFMMAPPMGYPPYYTQHPPSSASTGLPPQDPYWAAAGVPQATATTVTVSGVPLPPPNLARQLMSGEVPPQQQQPQMTKEEEEEAKRQKEARKKAKEAENTLEVWGNEDTMNMEHILATNIKASNYFKELYYLKTYHQILDEIYNQVDNLEPWVPNAGKTPSTAFCLLYKCFTIRLTRKQMHGMLTHKDSPYIRGMALIYLRLTCPPKLLWSWFEPYLDDPEELTVKAGPNPGKPTTIGRFAQQLLLEQRYFGILWPRVPVPIMKELKEKMAEYGPLPSTSDERDDDERYTQRSRGAGRRGGGGSRRSERSSPPSSRGGHKRSRSRSRERDRYSDRDRSRDRERDRERDRDRDRDRHRDKYRDREDARDRESKRRRSRSKSPPATTSRSSASSSTAVSAKRRAELEKLKQIYGSASTSTATSGSAKTNGTSPKQASVTEQESFIIGRRT